MSKGLCPPLDYEFNLRGKFSSQIYNSIEIIITRCNATLNSSCMTDADFAAYEAAHGQFVIMMPIIQKYVNAGN